MMRCPSSWKCAGEAAGRPPTVNPSTNRQVSAPRIAPAVENWEEKRAAAQNRIPKKPGGADLNVEYRISRHAQLDLLRVNGRDLEAPRLHAASADE